jgi:enhancing lycopene biosynthesis protein 2
MKKIAVIISGCGVYDGAEIHESVLTMLSIVKQGASYQLFAPDIQQFHVINHLNGEVMDEKRNVLVEGARIARGQIKPLSQFKPIEYDALIVVGGYGAAKNLCTFAVDGVDFTVLQEADHAIKQTHAIQKPIGALCISPVLISKILHGVKLTIGQDAATEDVIQQLGGVHQKTDIGGIVIDKDNKIVSTPCYMLDSNIYEMSLGIDSLVKTVLEMS